MLFCCSGRVLITVLLLLGCRVCTICGSQSLVGGLTMNNGGRWSGGSSSKSRLLYKRHKCLKNIKQVGCFYTAVEINTSISVSTHLALYGRCVFPQSVVCLAQPFDDVASSRTAPRPHHRLGASLKHRPSERRQIATNNVERFIVAAFLFALRRDFLLSSSLTQCFVLCVCVRVYVCMCFVAASRNGYRVLRRIHHNTLSRVV